MDRRSDSGGYELLTKGTDNRGPGWSVMALELFKIKVSCWFLLNSPTTACLYRQTCMHARAYSSGLDPYCLYTPFYQGFIMCINTCPTKMRLLVLSRALSGNMNVP